MKFPTCVLLALIGFGFILVRGDGPALCESWNSIEEKLKSKNLLISCTKSNDCYGINCTGAVQGYNISSWIQLHGCENPPYVEFDVDIPKLNHYDIKKKLYHNDIIHLTRNINLEFQVERKVYILTFGFIVHFLHMNPLGLSVIPVISNLNFSINCGLPPEATSVSSTVNPHISLITPFKTESVVSKNIADGYSNCSIINSTCSEEEVCQQIDKMKPDGICICMTNYTRNEDGKCVFHNESVDSSSVSLLLTAILVPIFVVLILVAAVYITIRFRVFQHLRRRLRVQVYEHVLLGEDEEEATTNPVI